MTRKITSAAAAIRLGRAEALALGNLDARRDWGYAPDYVRAMHAMLQRPSPKDYVVATGVTHSVRDVLKAAFSALELDYEKYVTINPEFFRPSEAVPLCGDASLARRELGWAPTKALEEVIREMALADLARLQRNS